MPNFNGIYSGFYVIDQHKHVKLIENEITSTILSVYTVLVPPTPMETAVLWMTLKVFDQFLLLKVRNTADRQFIK